MIGHVSDLQWDRMLAGDLAPEVDDAARAHATECATCATRLRELTAERDAFRLRPITIRFSPPRPWWIGLVVPVMAVASLLIVLRARPHEAGPGERSKGSMHVAGVDLLLSAGQPDTLALVVTGDVVHPGDYLQAGYTAMHPGFGAVLSRDDAGTTIAYVPSSGDAMVILAPGKERSFPESTILDAAPGSEHIVVVWCETMHLLAPLLEALHDGRPIASPGDCVLREVTLDKRSSTPARP